MAVDRVDRRVAAILAADVVGYSRLMGKDEESTLATLKAYRSFIDGLIAYHAGRVFGSAGDSVIAEFASPVEAVRCATEIQLGIDKQNAYLPEANRMRFRIGINLGDVVVDGDNLMGDGVNVAARLEALASPGGICISEAIHAQVRDRLSLDFLDLGEHSLKNIARPVRAYRVPLASEGQTKSPFRGLDVFDFDHADLFFGRARAVAACTERLEQQAANGKAFLLIYGMSGSGKSSLLRAGLLPTITRPGTVAGITLWRRCLFRPSEGSDAIASLAAGLLRDDALPELVREKTAAELADVLLGAADRALALIRAALGKAATAEGMPASQARLVLAVDQIEELFTTETEPASREAFVRLLAAFAASGLVWVIGTIRADFFHRCGEVPGFSALKDGLSSYELLPPTGPEIAQIIREPARATGLRFEENADQGRLEDVLQAAAIADPGSLPLLEFVLDALYEAGRDRRLLTFAAYRALGGLGGAIARRADEVVDALPPHIQEALPAVLRALTTVRLGEDGVTAAPASLADIAGTPAQSALVDALIAARLLVSDEDTEGNAVVRVAHEALLNRWPRARDIVNANRDFLETRARLRTDARRWHFDDRNPDLLLPPGKRLAEGEELLLSRREEVDDQIVDYIETSSSAWKAEAEKELQAERARIEAEAAAATRLARRTRYAAIVAIVLAAIAGAGAVIGFRGQREAELQAARAENSASEAKVAGTRAVEASENALAARDQALRNQSLSLSFLSEQTAASGDTEAAILLALEALPASTTGSDRPHLFEAEAALYNALTQYRQTMVLKHGAGVANAAFSPRGDRIVTSSYDNTARIWDAQDGSEIAVLRGHVDVVERTMFSPDESRVITASRDHTARIWDAESGKQLLLFQPLGAIPTAIFSPDGMRVLTVGPDNLALWDSRSGENIVTVPTRVSSFATFSPDGRTFAAATGSNSRARLVQGNAREIEIWNAETGRPISAWNSQTWPYQIAFSPDGKRLLVSAWEAISYRVLSRLFDVASKTESAAFSGHKSDTHGGTFSHDGQLIATVSIDGTARLWDGISGHLRGELGHESAGLIVSGDLRDQEVDSAFSPDDRLLATASPDGGIHLWDVNSASQLAIIRGHTDMIEHLEFSPDGKRLLTASHDGTARIWDIDGVLTTTLRPLSKPTFAAFDRQGTHIVTLGTDNVAHVWDVTNGEEIATLDDNAGELLQYAVFSPDGRDVVTASNTGKITSWDIKNRRRIARFDGHSSRVVSLEFSPDARLMLSSSSDGTARLWDTLTGAPISIFETGGTLKNSLLSPDGNLVLTGSHDGAVQIWKIDKTPFRVLARPDSSISAAAFSHDSQLVATGDLDGTARIWSIKDGILLNTLKGPNALLVDIKFSGDGKFVAAAYRDGTAHIWRVEDGIEQAVLRGHLGRLDQATFTPNGLYVVTSSSEDHTVRLWEKASGRQVAILTGGGESQNLELAPTTAAISPNGTMMAIVSGEEGIVRIVHSFATSQDLIDFAHAIVPRELTACERVHFFLPVEGDARKCPA